MGTDHSITVNYKEYKSINELVKSDRDLIYNAVEVSKTAYAPYSKFKVGAALELEGGRIVKGSNQENAAYPSGLCAERVALFSASAQFPTTNLKTLAIYAEGLVKNDDQISPCGSCRQVMIEYEEKQKTDIRLLIMNSHGSVWEFKSFATLLPFAFTSRALKNNNGVLEN